jgi:sulfur carrier protein
MRVNRFFPSSFSIFTFTFYFLPIRRPLLPHVSAAYDPPMHVQLSHPARTVEVKGPKKVKELLRELNLVVEAHLVIKGDDLVTEDEMLYDGDQIEIRPVISGGSPRFTPHVSPFTSPE